MDWTNLISTGVVTLITTAIGSFVGAGLIYRLSTKEIRYKRKQAINCLEYGLISEYNSGQEMLYALFGRPSKDEKLGIANTIFLAVDDAFDKEGGSD